MHINPFQTTILDASKLREFAYNFRFDVGLNGREFCKWIEKTEENERFATDKVVRFACNWYLQTWKI